MKTLLILFFIILCSCDSEGSQEQISGLERIVRHKDETIARQREIIEIQKGTIQVYRDGLPEVVAKYKEVIAIQRGTLDRCRFGLR